MKHLRSNIYDIDKYEEFDFIDEHPEITVVTFTDVFRYILIASKSNNVLLKLNKKTCKELEEKINCEKKQLNEKNEIWIKFKEILAKIHIINNKISMLTERKVNNIMYKNEPKILNYINQKILTELDVKQEIQKSLLVYIDFLIGDELL